MCLIQGYVLQIVPAVLDGGGGSSRWYRWGAQIQVDLNGWVAEEYLGRTVRGVGHQQRRQHLFQEGHLRRPHQPGK